MSDNASMFKTGVKILFGFEVLGVIAAAILFGRDKYGDFSFFLFLLIVLVGFGIAFLSFLFLMMIAEMAEDISAIAKRMPYEVTPLKLSDSIVLEANANKTPNRADNKKTILPSEKDVNDENRGMEEELNKKEPSISEKVENTDKLNSVEISQVVFKYRPFAGNPIICPRCGTRQSNRRNDCVKCGVKFVFASDPLNSK